MLAIQNKSAAVLLAWACLYTRCNIFVKATQKRIALDHEEVPLSTLSRTYCVQGSCLELTMYQSFCLLRCVAAAVLTHTQQIANNIADLLSRDSCASAIAHASLDEPGPAGEDITEHFAINMFQSPNECSEKIRQKILRKLSSQSI